MRDDIEHLLTLRPRKYRGCRARRAPGYPRAKLSRARELDALPTKEGLGGHYAERSFGEYFAPLVRYLRKNVGRLWSAVHAEIAVRVRPTSTVQRHVLVHLADFVEQSVWMKDGALWAHSRFGPRRLVGGGRDTRFYVCPRTGRLLRVPPASKLGLCTTVRSLGPSVRMVKLAKGWFRVELAEVPAFWFRTPARERPYDVLVEARVGTSAWQHSPLRTDARIFARGTFAASMRALSKRELRELLVKSEPV